MSRSPEQARKLENDYNKTHNIHEQSKDSLETIGELPTNVTKKMVGAIDKALKEILF